MDEPQTTDSENPGPPVSGSDVSASGAGTPSPSSDRAAETEPVTPFAGSDEGALSNGGELEAVLAPERASEESYARMVVGFWKEQGFAVAWTDSKTGEGAKRSSTSWNVNARAMGELGSEAGKFNGRIQKKNPIVVAHAIKDPNARELVLIDADGAEDLARYAAFDAPPTLTAQSSTPDKRHYYFAAPAGAKIHRIRFEGGTINADKNGYLVSPPALHPSGVKYKWLDRSVPIVELPRDIYDAMTGAVRSQDAEAQQRLTDDPDEKIVAGSRHRRQLALASAMRRHGVPEEMAEHVLLGFNLDRCDPPKADRLVRSLVEDVYRRYPTGDPFDLEGEAADAIQPPPPAKPIRRPGLKEDDLADHYRRVYGPTMRYFLEKRAWIFFENHRWHEPAGTHMAREACTKMFRSIYPEYAAGIDRDHADPDDVSYAEAAEKFSHERRIRTWRDNTLNIAEGKLLITADRLDHDHDVLAVGNGVLDLVTFELRDGRPDDYITVGSSVNYVSDARSSLWEDTFLPMAFPDDDLRAYLTRWAGLCLTGLTREELLWVFYGLGRNGKGTFLGGLAAVLGPELAIEINFATLATQKYRSGSSASPDVARMRGKRLVVASEKNAERVLDEERIKRLTGGDQITARYLNENEVQFPPTHKLVLSVNERPKINAADDAMRARVVLVPFLEQFTRENGKLDTTLKERLHTEAEHLEGILAWAVRGVRMYREQGLGGCRVIEEATAEYLTEMNPLADFVTQTFEVGERLETTGADMDALYRDHLHHSNDTRLSNTDFGQALRALGFSRKHAERGSVWTGLKPRGAVQS